MSVYDPEINVKWTADEKNVQFDRLTGQKKREWSVIYHAILRGFSPKWYITVQRSRHSIEFSCVGVRSSVIDNGKPNRACCMCYLVYHISITVTVPIYSMYVAIVPLELHITWDDSVRIIVRRLQFGINSQGQPRNLTFPTASIPLNCPSKCPWRSDVSRINPPEQFVSICKWCKEQIQKCYPSTCETISMILALCDVESIIVFIYDIQWLYSMPCAKIITSPGSTIISSGICVLSQWSTSTACLPGTLLHT